MTATTGVVVYSKTAAQNNTSDTTQNWSEGMAPSAVNDSARAGNASIAKWRDDNNGSLSTAGSSTAYTLTTNQNFAGLNSSFVADYTVAFQLDEDCGTPVTLNVDGLGAKPLRAYPGVELVAGALKSGGIYHATYKTSNSGEWLLHDVNPTIIAAGQVVTASITDANVTNAKLANMANATVKGRATSGSGVPEDITLGQGLVLNSTTLTAPAFPPSGSFKNLVIKVTGNTGLTVSADFVTTTDGTNYQTTAVNSTVNLGTNGGVDALEGSLTIQAATQYRVWAIAKADGTTKVLINTSDSAVTFPTGYTYKARIGQLFTASGSANLMGTWQLGRRAQYKVGLAQTSVIPVMDSGIKGSGIDTLTPTWAAVAIAGYVPTTASEIIGTLRSLGGNMMLAPSNGFSGRNQTNSPPFSCTNASSLNTGFSLIPESSNLYWVSDASGNQLLCQGWVDNI